MSDGTVSFDVGRKVQARAEELAREKGHPGVITRDLFVAMGRSIHPE